MKKRHKVKIESIGNREIDAESRFEWDRKMERTVDCKNALFPRVENDGT